MSSQMDTEPPYKRVVRVDSLVLTMCGYDRLLRHAGRSLEALLDKHFWGKTAIYFLKFLAGSRGTVALRSFTRA